MNAIKGLRRAELKMIARALGMTVKSSEHPDVVYAWFQRNGITLETVLQKHADLKRAIAGQLVRPNGGNALPTLSKTEIEQLVEQKILALQMATKPTAPTAAAVTQTTKPDAVAIDMKAVRKIIAEVVAANEPRKIILDASNSNIKPVKMNKHTHPMFEKVLRLVRAGLNVMLVGPAGCGKSHLAKDIADAMGRSFGALPCTGGASESALTGWLLPIEKGGYFSYVPAEFIELYQKGDSVFLLDEMDAADPNMLLVINAALANGELHVPQNFKAPHIKRGKNCAIIAAANTYGTGADTIYGARNQLDAATLDRFYVVAMDYDTVLEAQIMGRETDEDIIGWLPSDTENKATMKADVAVLDSWIIDLRRRTVATGIKRVVGTRMFQKALAARSFGIPVEQIKTDLMAGWRRDELAKLAAVA